MKKIAVCNQKGGVGKTATAVNVTAGLSLAEKEVILIDIDPQANATSGFGIDYKTLEISTYECLYQPELTEQAIVKTKWPHLSVLPSTPDLAGADIELVGQHEREFKLRNVLTRIGDTYEYGIIDCPPSLGILTVNGLVACDSVIIPIQCEYYALEGLSHFFRTVRLVRSRLNPRLMLEGILLTMFDGRNNLSRQVEQEVRKHFSQKVFQTIIPRNVRLGEAPSHGKPVLLYDIACPGSRAYFSLAQELIQNHGGRQ